MRLRSIVALTHDLAPGSRGTRFTEPREAEMYVRALKGVEKARITRHPNNVRPRYGALYIDHVHTSTISREEATSPRRAPPNL